jgi:alpha-L-fucosidase
LRLRNLKLKPGAAVSVLDTKKKLPYKQQGADCVVDLSSLKPGDAPEELIVLKLQHAL